MDRKETVDVLIARRSDGELNELLFLLAVHIAKTNNTPRLTQYENGIKVTTIVDGI